MGKMAQEAPIHAQELARHEARLGRRQEHDGGRDVGWRPEVGEQAVRLHRLDQRAWDVGGERRSLNCRR